MLVTWPSSTARWSQTSLWVHAHTDSADLIAAHDIGALGYFGGRPILDLAGLVNPEVIPFIRDQEKLPDISRFPSCRLSDDLPKLVPGFDSWSDARVSEPGPVQS